MDYNLPGSAARQHYLSQSRYLPGKNTVLTANQVTSKEVTITLCDTGSFETLVLYHWGNVFVLLSSMAADRSNCLLKNRFYEKCPVWSSPKWWLLSQENLGKQNPSHCRSKSYKSNIILIKSQMFCAICSVRLQALDNTKLFFYGSLAIPPVRYPLIVWWWASLLFWDSPLWFVIHALHWLMALINLKN